MENISGQIELYHNLYLFCLTGMLVFLAVSAVLFICLDIRTAVKSYTGMGRRRKMTKKRSAFFVDREILLVHTDEIIQEGEV